MSGQNRVVKVTLKAEIAEYIRDMLGGADATSKLGSSAKRAASDIDRALEQSDKAAKRSGQTFDAWGRVTSRAFAAVLLAAGAWTAFMIKTGIDTTTFVERADVALTNMLGSSAAAEATFAAVFDLAQRAGVSFPALLEQYQALAGSGLELGRVIPTLEAYTAAQNALGGDPQKMQRAVDATARIAAEQRVTAENLDAIARNGIPAWQMLADAAGKSVASVRADVAAGLYSADQAIALITDGMQARYGAALDDMGDSLSAWQNRFQNSQELLAKELVTTVVEAGKETMRALSGLFDGVTSELRQADWSPIIEPLLAIPEQIDAIAEGIDSGSIQGVIDRVGEGFEFAAETGEAFFNVAAPIVDVLAMAVAAGTPLLQVLTGMLAGFNALPAPVQASLVALLLFIRYQSELARVGGAVTGFITAQRASMAGFSRDLADAGVKSTIARGALVGVIQPLSLITQGARSAGSALLGAFGGPAGLAIAGGMAIVTFALSQWTAATQAQEEATRALSATLDQNTGAITAETGRTIATGLEQSGALEYLEQLGYSTDQVVAAIQSGGPAYDEISSSLQRAVEESWELLDSTRQGSEENIEAALRWSAAENALEAVQTQYRAIGEASEEVQRVARAAGKAVAGIDGSVTVDTSAAQANLDALTQKAQRALASFVNLKPTGVSTKKPSGGGGGGGGGESAIVKAAKAEQVAVKKAADADKKAAEAHEQAARDKADAARRAADEAVDALGRWENAEEESLGRLEDANFMYESAVRSRLSIEATLNATSDPARRAILTTALADATAHEAAMLVAKTQAEQAATAAVVEHTAAQQAAEAASAAQVVADSELQEALANSARVQEESAARVEAASERLAAATEAAASRGGGAVSGFAEDAKFSLQDYMATLREQVRAQEEWRDNMISLAGRVSSGTISALYDMGAEGAELVAALVNASDSELQEMDALFQRAGADISAQFASDMERLGILVPQIAEQMGHDSAEALKQEFQDGTVSIDDILTAFASNWDEKTLTMKIDADTRAAINAAGGIVQYVKNQIPTLRFSVSGGGGGGLLVMKAVRTGGPIEGPGPKGVDSVPLLAAPGEHMWTAAEVDAIGGHRAMERLRRMALDGSLKQNTAGLNPYPAPVAFAREGSGGGVYIYNTIYYPQAEAVSTQTNRDLQYAGEL